MRLICDAPFEIRSAEETEDGFLRVTGVAAKVGLLEYPEEDKVDRVTEDALTGKSLETMKAATLVMEHPKSSKVEPENFQKEAVGVVKDAFFEDGKQIVKIEIRDQTAIDAVKNGRKRGLSPGYEPKRVELDDDEEADRKQVGRRNNHLALTDSPRGEDETQLIVDSIIEDNSMEDEEEKDEKDGLEKDAADRIATAVADAVSAAVNDKLDSVLDRFDDEKEEDEKEEEMEKDAIKREFKLRRKAMDAADKLEVDYSDEDDTLKIMSDVVEEHTGSRLETDAKGAVQGAFHVAAAELERQKNKSPDAEKFEESFFETDSEDEDEVFEEVGMFT